MKNITALLFLISSGLHAQKLQVNALMPTRLSEMYLITKDENGKSTISQEIHAHLKSSEKIKCIDGISSRVSSTESFTDKTTLLDTDYQKPFKLLLAQQEKGEKYHLVYKIKRIMRKQRSEENYGTLTQIGRAYDIRSKQNVYSACFQRAQSETSFSIICRNDGRKITIATKNIFTEEKTFDTEPEMRVLPKEFWYLHDRIKKCFKEQQEAYYLQQQSDFIFPAAS